jgi:energy-converting hydrogenase Eha subunit A
MLKELLISVASGVIVALILQLFRSGGRSEPRPMRQSVSGYAPAPRRRSGIGGLFRLVFAVGGGIFLAGAAAPFVLGFFDEGRGGPRGGYYGGGRGGFDGGGRGWFNSGYFDGPDRFDGIFGLPPMLVLTVICTILVWALLSAMTRR